MDSYLLTTMLVAGVLAFALTAVRAGTTTQTTANTRRSPDSGGDGGIGIKVSDDGGCDSGDGGGGDGGGGD